MITSKDYIALVNRYCHSFENQGEITNRKPLTLYPYLSFKKCEEEKRKKKLKTKQNEQSPSLSNESQ